MAKKIKIYLWIIGFIIVLIAILPSPDNSNQVEIACNDGTSITTSSSDTKNVCVDHGGVARDNYESESKSEKKSKKVKKYKPYERNYFGYGWGKAIYYGYSVPLNNCNTRAGVLIKYSMAKTTYNSYCTIKSGKWKSVYTNEIMINPSKIDIDHLVPLQNAWISGAYKWSSEKRKEYANSKKVLVISDYSSNRQKGAKSIDEWHPYSNKKMCWYAKKWEKIKKIWHLSMTSAEKREIKREKAFC